jgi:drug/metabolite transporter (DMT)-like permease
MSNEHRLRFKTLFMILLMVVCANAGDLMLKRGMLQIGAVPLSLPGVWHTFLATIHSGTIWLGILFLLGFTLCYMTAVSWADYSYVMPAGAFGYAVQTLLAVVILHETVNAQRWFGVILICVGVLLVGQTKPNTTNAEPVEPVKIASQTAAGAETVAR